jgi:hypothetical protein
VDSRDRLDAVEKRIPLAPAGNRTLVVQPVACPYSNLAIPALSKSSFITFKNGTFTRHYYYAMNKVFEEIQGECFLYLYIAKKFSTIFFGAVRFDGTNSPSSFFSFCFLKKILANN